MKLTKFEKDLIGKSCILSYTDTMGDHEFTRKSFITDIEEIGQEGSEWFIRGKVVDIDFDPFHHSDPRLPWDECYHTYNVAFEEEDLESVDFEFMPKSEVINKLSAIMKTWLGGED